MDQPTTREERIRKKVMDAAIELISEKGLERTSIDEVARRSRVAKSTIYRHFPSKQMLGAEAVRSCMSLPTNPETGSLRHDLISCFIATAKLTYEGVLGPMQLSLMDAAQRDPQLRSVLDAQNELRRGRALSILERAVAAGKIHASVDLDLVVTLLSGSIFYTKLLCGREVTKNLIVTIVDTTLAGVAVLEHAPPEGAETAD